MAKLTKILTLVNISRYTIQARTSDTTSLHVASLQLSGHPQTAQWSGDKGYRQTQADS